VIDDDQEECLVLEVELEQAPLKALNDEVKEAAKMSV
jgi:hypothetical protein